MSEEKAGAIGFGVLVLVFVVLVAIFTSFTTIGVGQVGVLTSFGNVKGEVGSGVHAKLPWPYERVAKFNIQTQKDQADADASSADLQDVKVTLVTNYHIDPNKIDNLYRTVGTDYKARIIDPAIQESIKATTAEFAVGDLITKRPQLKADALKALQTRLAPRGIIVEDISITNLGFSADYTQAIEQKQVAQQDAEKATYNLQRAQVDAEANQVQTAALTPAILEQQAIAKWNGVLPTTVSGTDTILSVPVK